MSAPVAVSATAGSANLLFTSSILILHWLWRLWVCGRRRAFPRFPSWLGRRGKRSRVGGADRPHINAHAAAFTSNPQKPLFDLTHANERVAAAAEAARKLPFPFSLTARAENFLRGNPDLDDTIKRLRAFEAAGADVLMAPGLPDLAAVRTVCTALSRPFNFMAG